MLVCYTNNLNNNVVSALRPRNKKIRPLLISVGPDKNFIIHSSLRSSCMIKFFIRPFFDQSGAYFFYSSADRALTLH